jgi:ribonuclease HII
LSLLIAGVDEAGRGPLAGPVVAAAAILPEGMDLDGIDDSKKLDAVVREALADRIRGQAIWAIAEIDVAQIDRDNILWATMRAMERAVADLPQAPAEVWVDGNRVPPGLASIGRAIVDGDALHACIAAASIIAKCHRDALMRAYHEQYPQYGFDRHFGYATPEHLAALAEHGPCPIHRRSFAPVRAKEQLCFDLGES